MAKSLILDEKAKRDLNNFCRAHGLNFPLGDWIGAISGLLAKLDADSGVTDTDYEETLDIDGNP